MPPALALALLLSAADDFVPKLTEFPPRGVAGNHFAGELVAIDPVNRRGALRLDGDTSEDKYHSADPHRFALLPYGTVRYRGAPAELRDIPIGTHLHGMFLLPPVGDTSVPPPKRSPQYVPKYTHALTLEDDFSFEQRHGRAWKVVAVDAGQGKLKAVPEGEANPNGLQGEQTFEFDASTRVWLGKGYGDLKDVTPGRVVQLGLTWSPNWVYGQFHVADLWLDDESRAVASERQRQVHIRHARTRWLPGRVDRVEHQAGGKGVVSVTLFGGCDASLYEAARAKGGEASLAAAEPTLRSYWQDHDKKTGPVLGAVDEPNPPPGSSGLTVRVQVYEVLEGYRPGRVVRLRPGSFPSVKLPPEERVQGVDDR